jgi:tetratricopeptide (TPR) repeat protein
MSDWFEAERRAERAQQLCEVERWEEALQELEAALAINPNNATWHAQRGVLLSELERSADAVEAYGHALDLEPNDPEVSIALGIELTRLGHYSRALSVFEELARTHPDLEPAYCHRISIYTELGRHDQAEEMFYLAQQLDETCPHCFFYVGVSLAARGQTQRAIHCWRKVLALEPDYPGVRQRIAQAFRAEGKLDAAREYLLQELRDDPGNTDYLFELGELAQESGQLEAAVNKFYQIVELEPGHAPAQFALGKLLMRFGRPAEALRCFETAAGLLDEDRHELDVYIGEALYYLDRLGEARERFEHALSRDPADTDAEMMLAQCLLAMNQPRLAADSYRKVLAVEEQNAQAHLNLAVCLYQLDQVDAAVSHCEAALNCDEEYLLALQYAVVGYRALGRWRDAHRLLDRAIALEPGDAGVAQLAQKSWRYRWYRLRRRLIGRLRGGRGKGDSQSK